MQEARSPFRLILSRARLVTRTASKGRHNLSPTPVLDSGGHWSFDGLLNPSRSMARCRRGVKCPPVIPFMKATMAVPHFPLEIIRAIWAFIAFFGIMFVCTALFVAFLWAMGKIWNRLFAKRFDGVTRSE